MAGVDLGTRILDKVLKSLSILHNNQNISRIVGVNSINPIFITGAYTNKQLYDLISSTVECESSTTVKVLAENFTKSVLSLYQLLNFTSNVQQLQSEVQTELEALKKVYQSNIGDVDNFPDAILEWASPPTTWKTLLNTVDVGQVLNSPPIGGESVIPSILQYINAKKALQNAENEIQSNQSIVKSLITATTHPTLPNACQFKDPPSIKPLYKVNLSNTDQIEAALSNNSSSIDVNFKIVKSQQQKMTIDFNSNESIDVSSFINQDWFTQTAGNTSISISNLFTLMSSFEITIEFVWKGITALSPTPASYPNGWFSSEQINEAIRNSKNHNSSGWQFSKTPNVSSISMISQLFISNPPQITVVAKNTSAKSNFMNNSPLEAPAPVPDEVDITGFNLFGWNFQFACSYHSNIAINASSIECTFVPSLNNASPSENSISTLLGVLVSTPFCFH